MTTIETTVPIFGPPPTVVAAALFKPDNAVQWQSNLERCEVVAGTAGEAGAKVHLHFVNRRKRHMMVDILEIAEPATRYVSHLTGDGMTIRIETILNPVPDGTKLTVTWAAEGDSWLSRILLRTLRGAIAERAAFDLTVFKRLVETYGAEFPSP